MLRTKSSLALSVAVMLLAVTGCTNDNLDDGGSADVVLEIETLENPPVTATLDSTTGFCTFTVSDWRFGARNLPKNELAGESGFNDISMTQVTITYDWINPALSTPTRVIGLGGIIVPVNGTASLELQPISFDDLAGVIPGSTANLTMRFDGVTVEGSAVWQIVGRQLFIEGCI